MSDGASLLAYCHQHPEDDLARLAYAEALKPGPGPLPGPEQGPVPPKPRPPRRKPTEEECWQEYWNQIDECEELAGAARINCEHLARHQREACLDEAHGG